MKAKFVNEEFTYLKSKTPKELKKAAKADLSQENYAKFGDTIDALIDKGYIVSGVSGVFQSVHEYPEPIKIILHYYQIYEGNNGIARALTPNNAEAIIKALKKYGYTDRQLKFELSTWQTYLTIEQAKELLNKK